MTSTGTTATHALQVRTRAIVWFGFVVFGYYYKALLCGYVEQTHDLRAKHVRRAIRDLEGEAA